MKAKTSTLDTSAVLALLLEEPGSVAVEAALNTTCFVSAAIWSEIAQKSAQKNLNWTHVRAALQGLGINVVAVGEEDAELAAELWQPGNGLSLADRLCLALGHRLDAEILTADQAWAGLPGVTVIR